MQEFEKLGAFYLGREYDVAGKARLDAPVLYDSRDLLTHGVIVGMTGSGKTGLGIALLEEAAIDGVPAMAIDLKGDLTNLLLTFPNLDPQSFRPWVSAEEAARKDLSVDELAAKQASAWQEGLAEWGQDAKRIVRLRNSADAVIYTPGSSAGLGVSVLKSFDAPPPEVRDDRELFAERVGAAVTGLLTLVGVNADPVQSRDHILLSTIVSTAWQKGENLELGALIERIQNPPVARIGVLDLEAFYPAKDRFELALKLNGLLAAPSFAAWLEGDPLDIDRMLFSTEGKPRLAVVSIAHLGDAERMFFMSLLLSQLVAWMRRQQGTTSLRALLYMDEVAGYLPPTANPPSKPALLTLLKQARAFGLGVVLSTQNPVDLDYKALSNAGTWWLGRLQTEQDKARLLDGLEGAMAGRKGFSRSSTDKLLSSLGKRIFLQHNVHDEAPVTFETRWVMSYLAGPLTRDQIRTLMASRVGSHAAPPPPDPGAATSSPPQDGASTSASAAATAPPPVSTQRPIVSPGVPEFFAPVRSAAPHARYAPTVFASGQVGFTEPKLGVSQVRDVAVTVPIDAGPIPVDWTKADTAAFSLTDLTQTPAGGAAFDPLPPAAANAKSYPAWEKEFGRWLAQSQTLDLVREPTSGLVSKPGESEGDFRVRLQLALREKRDAGRSALERKYGPKMTALNEKRRRALAAVEREAAQATEQKMQTAVSVGATVFQALFGRKAVSSSTIGRATTAARGLGRASRAAEDVKRAEEGVQAIERQIADLDGELKAELASLEARHDPLALTLEPVSIRTKRTQVTVQRVVLAWVPG